MVWAGGAAYRREMVGLQQVENGDLALMLDIGTAADNRLFVELELDDPKIRLAASFRLARLLRTVIHAGRLAALDRSRPRPSAVPDVQSNRDRPCVCTQSFRICEANGPRPQIAQALGVAADEGCPLHKIEDRQAR